MQMVFCLMVWYLLLLIIYDMKRENLFILTKFLFQLFGKFQEIISLLVLKI